MKNIQVLAAIVVFSIPQTQLMANDIEQALVGVSNIINTIQIVENAKTVDAQQGLTDIAINAGGTIGGAMDSIGEGLIKTSGQALQSSNKLAGTTNKLKGLLVKYKGLVRPEKLEQLKKVIKVVSDKSEALKKISSKASANGKVLKVSGKALSSAATTYFFSKKVSEYNQKRRSGTASIVDHMKIAKDATVAIVSTVSPVGVVDLVVDLAVDEIDRVGGIKRDSSNKVAYSMRSIKNKHINQLRNDIAKASSNGDVLTRSKISAMYREMSQNLRQQLNKRKRLFEQTGAYNSAFDGDVGIRAYDDGIDYANRILDGKKQVSDIERLEKISVKIAIESLINQINNQSIQLDDSITKLGKIEASAQRMDAQLSKVYGAIEKARALDTNEDQQAQVIEQDNRIDGDGKARFVEKSDGETVQASTAILGSKKISLENESKKQEADTLLSQNKKRAENYQSLYIKLKNDPSNRDLKRRVDNADRLLRESTAKYIAVRGEIRKTEPNYGQLAYSRNAIRSRIDEKFSAQHIVKEKIARVSQEQISKEAQLRKIQTKVSEFRSNRKSKQSKLNKLIRRQQAMPSVIKRYEIELKTLKFRVKILQAVSKIKKSFSRKRKTIKSLPKKVKDALKKAADRLGTNWQKMYILAERLYDKANQEATDLQIRIVKTSNLSTREALLVTRLKREIKSLESQINVANSNTGRIQRELAKLTNEQQTYNKELTTLQQAATSVEAPITKHSYNYNEYSPNSLVSLGNTITHPEQTENEVIQTTQLDQQENQRQAEEQAIREFNDSQRVELAETAPNQPEQPTTPPTTPAPETPAGKYRGIYSAISPTLHSYYYIEQADNTEFGKDSANQNVALNPEIVTKNINTGNGDHFGGYQYTALGQWNSDNHVLVDPDNGTNHHLNGGYWVIGQDATDIPAQGSASYSGELNGDYTDSSGSVSRGVIGGTIGLNVAFSNKTISGNLFVTKSGDFYSAAEFSNTTIGQSIDGAPAGVDLSNVFQADMTITGGVGTGGEIGGFIYGQGAAEVGGGWQIDEGGGDSSAGAAGVFRAKQSQATSPNLNPSLEWGGWGSVVGSDTTSSGPDSYQYASTGTEAPHNALPKGGSSTQINLDGVNQSVTATPDYGDYDYVAWGTWDGGSSTTFERYDGAIFNDVKGHWAYGQALGADDIPRYGSANYAGQVMGGYVHHGNGIVEANSISGDINMAVDFRDGNNSLSGTMNLDRNGSDWATATFNTQNARANPTDPDFKTPLNVVNGGNGELNGAFFGANAAEVGGSFYVDKQHGDGGGAAGVYRAKKQ